MGEECSLKIKVQWSW